MWMEGGRVVFVRPPHPVASTARTPASSMAAMMVSVVLWASVPAMLPKPM